MPERMYGNKQRVRVMAPINAQRASLDALTELGVERI